MTRELIFLPVARIDFDEAFDYYENLSPRREGKRFENAFRKSLRQIRSGLITHRRVFEDFHRVFVPRYPYIIDYRLADNKVVIVGILYARFDPKKIEASLGQRI